VCGHYDCSGIKASLDKVDLASPLEEWVCNIRDVYRLHKLELDGIRDPERRRRKLVELNTREQAVNVHKAAVVQRRRLYTHMKEGLALPKVGSRR
jgi:carbonic anhydrase